MSVLRFFTDSRRERSQDLTVFAENKASKGDFAGARADYAEAARLEEENALDVDPAFPKVRSVLAISAVALWLRAERWDDAARADCVFLAEPGKLLPDGCDEIQKLVDRARHEAAQGMPIETTLSGGTYRQ